MNILSNFFKPKVCLASDIGQNYTNKPGKSCTYRYKLTRGNSVSQEFRVSALHISIFIEIVETKVLYIYPRVNASRRYGKYIQVSVKGHFPGELSYTR